MPPNPVMPRVFARRVSAPPRTSWVLCCLVLMCYHAPATTTCARPTATSTRLPAGHRASRRVIGMKRVGLFFVLLTLALASTAVVGAASNKTAAPAPCATIQGGTITDSAGNAVSTGYDKFGYNYQAHMFNGTYDSSDRVLDGLYFGDAAS